MSISKKKIYILVGMVIAVSALLFYGFFDRETKSNNDNDNEKELTVDVFSETKLDAQTAIDDKTIIFKDIVEDYKHYFHDTDTDCYSVVDTSDNIICYVLFTSPYCDDIIGYEGPVPFAIILEPDYRIKKLYLLKNQETQEWIDMLYDDALFDKWNGFTLKQAIEIEVDAVSGATYSSDAIIQSIKKRVTLFLSSAGSDISEN